MYNKEKKAIVSKKNYFKNINNDNKNNDNENIIKYIQVAEDILFIVSSLLKIFKNTIK